MSLRFSQPTSKGLYSISFNQDASCIITSGSKGVSIWSLENDKRCIQLFSVGATSISTMLYCTSLLAFAGAGDQPTSSPRRLTVFNTANQTAISNISFPSSVLSILLNRKHLCVILESRAHLYTLQSLQLLSTISYPPNPKGIGAITQDQTNAYLALPISSSKSIIAIHDIATKDGGVLEIDAHQSTLALLQWNADGTLLASASMKGTVVRVWHMPQGTKAFSLRRGTSPARITSVAFSPASVYPPLVCVASDHASIHIFRLESPSPKNGAAAVAQTMINSMIPKHPSSYGGGGEKIDILKLQKSCGRGTPIACAMRMGKDGVLKLCVVSEDGILYVYSMDSVDQDRQGGYAIMLENEFVIA